MRNLNFKLVILWIINPFISFCFSIKHLSHVSVAYFMLFSFFFGFSFVVSDSGADSQEYALYLKEYHQKQISFQELTSNYYSEEGGIDIYQQTITWFIANFTDDPRWLFGVFAVIFGYFWFGIQYLVKNEIGNRPSFLVVLVLIATLLINPIWNINGVRMWTATVMFTYGVLLCELKNTKKGWLFILIPMLVHFSLVSVIFWYITYKILPIKQLNILFAAFIITFIVSEIDLNIVKNYFELLPNVVKDREKGYLHEDTIEQYAVDSIGELKSIHVQVFNFVNRYISITIAIILFFFKNSINIKENEVIIKWFKFALFMGVFANIASNIPSGSRFIIISNTLFFLTLIFFLKHNIKLGRNLKLLITIPFLIMIIFQLRLGLDFISIFFFIGNPIANFFIRDSDPVIETIKSILF